MLSSSLSCGPTQWQHPWANIPVCFANDQTHIAAVRATPTLSSGVTFTASSVAAVGDTIAYHCEGNPN